MLKNLALLMASILLFFGCAQVNSNLDSKENEFVAMENDRVDNDVLMIIMNASQTMNEYDANNFKKIDALKEVVLDVSNQLEGSGSNLALMSYGGICNSSKIHIRPSDMTSANDVMYEVDANGYNSLGYSIKSAGSILKLATKKIKIVLVADGKDECKGNPINEADKLVKYFGDRLELNVVGYNVEDKVKYYLMQIATAGNGKYFNASSLDELSRAFNDVVNEMNVKSKYWKGNVLNLNITFDSGSAKLKDEYTSELMDLVNYLINTRYLVEIQGHTDSTGSAEANRILSQKRAESVARKLVELGVYKEQVTAIGYGESRPLYTNELEKGKLKNRRVEAHILKTRYKKVEEKVPSSQRTYFKEK